MRLMHKPKNRSYYSIWTCATSPSSSVKTSRKCDFPPFLTFVRSTTASLKNELFGDVQWSHLDYKNIQPQTIIDIIAAIMSAKIPTQSAYLNFVIPMAPKYTAKT